MDHVSRWNHGQDILLGSGQSFLPPLSIIRSQEEIRDLARGTSRNSFHLAAGTFHSLSHVPPRQRNPGHKPPTNRQESRGGTGIVPPLLLLVVTHRIGKGRRRRRGIKRRETRNTPLSTAPLHGQRFTPLPSHRSYRLPQEREE